MKILDKQAMQTQAQMSICQFRHFSFRLANSIFYLKCVFMWLKKITVLLKFDLSNKNEPEPSLNASVFSPKIMVDYPIFQYIHIYLSRQTHVFGYICMHTCTSSHSMAN